MAKKEATRAKRNELKEEKKDEWFREFMLMQAKKVSIEENKLPVKKMCEESKVLYVKVDDLNLDVSK